MEIVTTNKAIRVYGLKVRTKNENEINADKAQIGPMWQKFFTEIAPVMKEGSHTYGVYCNYESDASGEFDVWACTDQEIDSLESTVLETGKFKVFKGEGEMPQAVIETWQRIWNYFLEAECPDTRAYSCDYEVYESQNEVSIYIGIK